MNVRKAFFAGSWYPSQSAECEKEIKSFVQQQDFKGITIQKPNGGIVPHAGWYFSGRIACNVIRFLAKGEKPDLVAVFGMHLHPRSRPVITAGGFLETPFGSLEIDEALSETLAGRFDFRIETPESFEPDNTVELQLPFIRYFFGDVKVVTLGVPPSEVAVKIGKAAVDAAAESGKTLKIIGSTDLTHYGPNYGFMPAGAGAKAHDWVVDVNDRRAIDTILSLDAEGVLLEAAENHNACCSGAVAAAISAAKALGSDKAELMSYATSNEKAKGESFVGYAGVVF